MSRRPPRNILSQYYFLDFSALAFAVLSLTHLAVIVLESLALDSHSFSVSFAGQRNSSRRPFGYRRADPIRFAEFAFVPG